MSPLDAESITLLLLLLLPCCCLLADLVLPRCNSECANPHITEVPPQFDLISVDTYAGYRPGSNGTDEVVAAKKIFGDIFPKLHGHQQVLVVPGTFACSNLSYFPLEQQAKNVVDKLDGYWAWMQNETRIAGMLPCALFQ